MNIGIATNPSQACKNNVTPVKIPANPRYIGFLDRAKVPVATNLMVLPGSNGLIVVFSFLNLFIESIIIKKELAIISIATNSIP